jgi:hypothetical protein
MLPRPTIGGTRSVLDSWDGSGWNKKDFDTLWAPRRESSGGRRRQGSFSKKSKVFFRLLSPGADLDCPHPSGDVRVRLPTVSQAAGHPVGGRMARRVACDPARAAPRHHLAPAGGCPVAGMFTGVRILSVARVLP